MPDAMPSATPAARRAQNLAAMASYAAANHWTGSKYEPGLSLAEIKRRVLADLKSAGLPTGVRVTARVPNYSMANAIVITAKVPFAAKLDDFRSVGNAWTNLTDEAYAVLVKVVDVANAYNFDKSDPLSDFTHKNFDVRVHVEAA